MLCALCFSDPVKKNHQLIWSYLLVTFDLELSGIHRAAFSKNPTLGRRQNLEERYKEVKEAAERFQILQFGLCTITASKETGTQQGPLILTFEAY